jgi:hypothetical protein
VTRRRARQAVVVRIGRAGRVAQKICARGAWRFQAACARVYLAAFALQGISAEQLKRRHAPQLRVVQACGCTAVSHQLGRRSPGGSWFDPIRSSDS